MGASDSQPNGWTLELSKEWWRGEYETERQRTVSRQLFPVRSRLISAPQSTQSPPESSPQPFKESQLVPLPLYSYSRPPSYCSSHAESRINACRDVPDVDRSLWDPELYASYPQSDIDPILLITQEANPEAQPQAKDLHNRMEAVVRTWVPPTREDLPQMAYLDESPLLISSCEGGGGGLLNPEAKRRNLQQRLLRAVRIMLRRGGKYGDRGWNSEENEEADRKRIMPSWMDLWE